MKTRKKFFMIIFMLLILLIRAESKAVEEIEEEITTEVKISPAINSVDKDVSIPVEIYVKNLENGVYSIDTLINYNSEIFYDLTEKDFSTNLDTYVFQYNEEDRNFSIIVSEPIKEGIMFTINLTPKITITTPNTKIELLKLYDMYIVRGDKASEVVNEMNTSIWNIGENQEETDDKDNDKLYLSSNTYKIGNEDIENYENGDKYISRVEKETTVEKFISKLNTNGKIKVLKQNGTELKENEIVGTGMTLEVTRDEEKIQLKIAVMGDLSGDGKITATDLSTINQVILKLVMLEDEYKIAADLDENDNLTATDLSTLNKMLLKIV